MTNEEFINLVNLCAQQNGCTITDIDFDNMIVNLDGPTEEAQVACAVALEELFGRYVNDGSTTKN